ncbi:MAG: hypothetical protein KDJ90_12740 [Nitratireductor sp.]|nr:hypothetical protein [Nitratireductor sp.]
MKKATKRPRPNEGGSYILKPGGKLDRREFTKPAPGRAERRKDATEAVAAKALEKPSKEA